MRYKPGWSFKFEKPTNNRHVIWKFRLIPSFNMKYHKVKPGNTIMENDKSIIFWYVSLSWLLWSLKVSRSNIDKIIDA